MELDRSRVGAFLAPTTSGRRSPSDERDVFLPASLAADNFNPALSGFKGGGPRARGKDAATNEPAITAHAQREAVMSFRARFDPWMETVSLDEPIGHDTTTTRGDMLGHRPDVEGVVYWRERKQQVLDAVRKLNKRHQRVILAKMAGDIDRDLVERMGVTRQRVQQLKDEAFSRLSKILNTQPPERDDIRDQPDPTEALDRCADPRVKDITLRRVSGDSINSVANDYGISRQDVNRLAWLGWRMLSRHGYQVSFPRDNRFVK